MPIHADFLNRLKGGFIDTIHTHRVPPGTPADSYSITTRQNVQEVRMRTSTGTRRIKPKVLTPTNYYLNVQRSFATRKYYYLLSGSLSGNYQEQYGGGAALADAAGGFDLPVTGFSWDPLYNRALEKVNDKIRGDLDLAVDLAQAGQTVKMLRASDSIVKYVEEWTKRKSTLRALIRIGSAARLEFIYGWKPLASDLYSAADESLRLVLNKIDHVSGTAQSKLTPDYLGLSTSVGAVNFPIRSANMIARLKLGISVTVPGFDLARWSSLNPVSIFWEALPFSFVADWVYNVGGYIRNMETGLLYGSRFRIGYVSKTVRASVVGMWSDGFWDVGGETLDFTRTVLTSYPLPALPHFEVEMGSSRLLNAAALLGQFIRR